MRLRILSASDIRLALPMTSAIAAVESAFIEFSSGRATAPPRAHITPDPYAGTTLFMPAFLPSLGAFGVKIISIFPGNSPCRIPTIHALVLLLDPATGVPLGILDGGSLTALRTGAASGVATKYLSRPEASSAAVIGAGVQGRGQLEAVCSVRRIERAFVFDIRSDAAGLFAKELSGRGAPFPSDIRPVSSPADAIRQAEIVCCATTSRAPVFADTDIAPGVHINAIGSYEPHVQEVPPEILRRSSVFVDSVEASLAETGDFLVPMASGLFSPDMIRGEIGSVASGDLPGRSSPREITVFKSVGLAVQDVCAGRAALAEAERLGLGMTIDV
ncbi:MAG: hypothetical protein A2Y56_08500 [Candidatus Aminicenantes bacterium RBG_13_63_10]|nr:MAG: hypothetical protein A2Y56_08500 [Candidatus Aminicenantes bacterium RBG_13_63_10]